MLNLANLKVAVVLKQQSETNGGTLTSDAIDTLGSDFVKIIVHGTTSNNATNKPSVLKVQQSDTTDASNYSDITALVGGGTGGFTIPSAPTSTTTKPYAIFNVDTRTKKRYLRVITSPVTTQTYSNIAIFGRAEQAAVGTAAENAAVVVNG